MIERDLSRYAHRFEEYTEFRMQENAEIGIRLVKGNLVGNSRSSSSGVSARVCKEGAWGFASRPDLTDDAALSVIKTATENARALAAATHAHETRFPPMRGSVTADYSTQRPRYTQGAMVDFAMELDSHVARSYPSLASRRVTLGCAEMVKSLVTSDGATSFSHTPRSLVSVSLSAETSTGPVDVFDVWGGLGHFEDRFDKPEDLWEKIEALHRHLVAKEHATYARAGVAECILDPDLAGLLAHEAIGHTVEADFVQGGSIAADFLGKEVASPLVTLVDFAHTALGQTCPVPVHMDDEGVVAHDAILIERGVLKGYLHNRESAHRFDALPAGNARAFRFSDEPLIRMRNTAILPGSSSLEEMIASVDDGYYLVRSGNGQADSTSEFMFGVVIGYEIKQGKLGRAIRDTTISGVAFDLLKTISMTSRDMAWSAWGMCGKKQSIPVSLGGPAIKCTVNIGGR